MPVCNTTVWNTHCGVGYNYVYTFACSAPEAWLGADRTGTSRLNVHYAARAPGATDALLFFYQLNESTRRSMLPASGLWSFNEAILTAGQATADNLVPQLAEIDYMVRAASIDQANAISAVMDNNAEAAAKAGFCRWRKTWVSKSRAGLANHVLARAGYRNLELARAPHWGAEAIRTAQEIQRHLGMEPHAQPFAEATERLVDPQVAETAVRKFLPEVQEHLTSDDYTEYTWHCPTVRLIVARPVLCERPGFSYPAWVHNALGGIPATIDPTIQTAAKAIGATLVDLLTDAELLARAHAEFVERTGGGVGGERWQAPLLPRDFEVPHRLRWPEYVTTARGEEWCIPWREGE
jgi:aminobenzoyl-glutamate utilization protein B